MEEGKRSVTTQTGRQTVSNAGDDGDGNVMCKKGVLTKAAALLTILNQRQFPLLMMIFNTTIARVSVDCRL